MNRIRLVLMAILIPAIVYAASHTVVANFSPPTIGVTPDGYNLYVDDCAPTGPVAAPEVPDYVSGQSLPGLLPADGIYQICIRPYRGATERVAADPVATVVVPALGPIENLSISCPSSDCFITIN